MDRQQPLPSDEALIDLLQDGDEKETRQEMRDGSTLIVFNIAWGYDMGRTVRRRHDQHQPCGDGASVGFSGPPTRHARLRHARRGR